MNIRTASLLTALLFLAAPLALVPSATAQAFVTDCIDMSSGVPMPAPDNGQCGDVSVPPTTIPPAVLAILCTVPEVGNTVGGPGSCVVGPEPPCDGTETEVGCIPPVPPAVIAALCTVPTAGPLVVDQLGGECLTGPPAPGPVDPIVIPSPAGDLAVLTVESDADDNPVVHVHFTSPQPRPGPTFADGVGTVQDLYVQASLDLDNDGDGDYAELSCRANPFNPAATCKDADGDGLPFYATSTNAAGQAITAFECAAVGGTFDGTECTVDAETNCPRHDPGKSCDPYNWNTDRGTKTATPESDKLDPFPTDATNDDADNDGLTSPQETACGTSPTDDDFDNDGLKDGPECGHPADTRDDSDPLLADTDGDGYSDKAEVDAGTKPNDATSHPVPAVAGPDGCLNSDSCGLPGQAQVLKDNPAWCDPTDSTGLTGDDPSECVPSGAPGADPNELCAANEEADEDATFPDCILGAAPGPDTLCAANDEAEEDAAFPDCILAMVPGADTLDALCTANEDAEEGAAFPDCILALVPDNLPLPGTPVDVRDPWDTNGNGRRDEPNGQVDIVEEYVGYVDQDEPASSPREKNADLEGEDGATLVLFTPRADLGGSTTVFARVRVGDVSSTGVQELAVVQSPQGYVCIFLADGTPVVATGPAFVASADEPCATRVLWEAANAQLAAAGVSVVDQDGDLVPEALVVGLPDLEDCPGTVGPSPVPDPTSCGTTPTVIPIGGGPVDPGALPVDPTTVHCMLDASLPGCPDEPGPGEDPCDPAAEGFPEGCEPPAPGELPADPSELCGNNPDVDAILVMLGVECAPGEPDPCDEDPEAEGCDPVGGLPGDPSGLGCDPTGMQFVCIDDEPYGLGQFLGLPFGVHVKIGPLPPINI